MAVKNSKKKTLNRRGKVMATPVSWWRSGSVLAAIGVIVISIAGIVYFSLIDSRDGRSSQSSRPDGLGSAEIADAPVVQIPQINAGEIIRDVPYCNGLSLDIYQPRKVIYERTPVVMYIHGGGWQINDKASEPGQLQMIDGMRDEGFAMVSMDYYKLPDHRFPAPVEDVLCAVRFLRANADKYYLDEDRFAVYGFSAGGHLAAMVGTLDTDNPFNNGQYAEHSSRVQAVVSLAGLLHFEQGLYPRNHPRINQFVGGYPKSAATPSSYVSSNDPPFMLIHGDKDSLVPVSQDDEFEAILNQNKIEVERIVVRNAGHGLDELGEPIVPSRNEVKARMHEFIKRELDVAGSSQIPVHERPKRP